MTDILDIILEFIRNEIVKNPEQVPDPQENLLASGVIDSVGIMLLVRHLEATLDSAGANAANKAVLAFLNR